MISVDTNVLLYSLNSDCPEFERASEVVRELSNSTSVVICELVLVELYLLLRSPAVVPQPLSAGEAAATCSGFRRNPKWRLVESAPVMSDVWKHAATEGFARRRIIDARLALTLRHHRVTELWTRNTADFVGFGFERVWDPLAPTG